MDKKELSAFFPSKNEHFPTIYGYTLPNSSTHQGLIKVGYTNRDAKTRIKEQVSTSGQTYKLLFEQPAMRADGSAFTDREVHKVLRKKGMANPMLEWYQCTVEQLTQAYNEVVSGGSIDSNRTASFGLRPEQKDAIAKTMDYFARIKKSNPDTAPKMLWNAKMRFGKTFTAYQLAKKMGWSKLLILTYKPAVQSAWEDDLNTHQDFKGWQFIHRRNQEEQTVDTSRPIVCFGSFQDYLGRDENGKIKPRNQWVHNTQWDCIIMDEYHFGAWREAAKELVESDDNEQQAQAEQLNQEQALKELASIQTDHYLYLSGTPFRALSDGEFLEDQIYNWTYSDEQRAKTEWQGENNPYASLPKLIMFTYQLPELIKKVAAQGEYNEFALNEFFKAEGNEQNAKFKHENEVQQWLHFITARPQTEEEVINALKQNNEDADTELQLEEDGNAPMPFGDSRLLSVLLHTFWFLPNVASCYAMKNLLEKPHNTFFHSYKIVVAAGIKAGIGVEALKPVEKAMQNPLKSKSITLSCGKLTTGVSVKPWTGLLMLRDTSSPESYFQTAFRVQTPWTVKNIDGQSPNEETILKKNCYVFDFAPNRALRLLADYSQKLNIAASSKEQSVRDLIQYLPVLAYDGAGMQLIDAGGVLDMAISGTTATLLARRWKSAQLVNVDNMTLQNLLNNQQALDALKNIEGFRAINAELQTIINKANEIKPLKNKAKELNKQEKKQLTEAQKEYKSLRKEVQEKLIKLATRIPVFMYLSDYREQELMDVITRLEPELFRKVTGLHQKDFNVLVELNVFHKKNMDDAVRKFKSYEDTSFESYQ